MATPGRSASEDPTRLSHPLPHPPPPPLEPQPQRARPGDCYVQSRQQQTPPLPPCFTLPRMRIPGEEDMRLAQHPYLLSAPAASAIHRQAHPAEPAPPPRTKTSRPFLAEEYEFLSSPGDVRPPPRTTLSRPFLAEEYEFLPSASDQGAPSRHRPFQDACPVDTATNYHKSTINPRPEYDHPTTYCRQQEPTSSMGPGLPPFRPSCTAPLPLHQPRQQSAMAPRLGPAPARDRRLAATVRDYTPQDHARMMHLPSLSPSLSIASSSVSACAAPSFAVAPAGIQPPPPVTSAAPLCNKRTTPATATGTRPAQRRRPRKPRIIGTVPIPREQRVYIMCKRCGVRNHVRRLTCIECRATKSEMRTPREPATPSTSSALTALQSLSTMSAKNPISRMSHTTTMVPAHSSSKSEPAICPAKPARHDHSNPGSLHHVLNSPRSSEMHE